MFDRPDAAQADRGRGEGIYLKNTFLHFSDAADEARGLSSRRSRSHDISSSSSSHSRDSFSNSFSGSREAKMRMPGPGKDHIVFETSSESFPLRGTENSSESSPHKNGKNAGAKMDSDKSGEQDLEPEDDADLPSVGAKLHAAGTCTPCRFETLSKCKFGNSCYFCHASGHKFAKAHRPAKSVRAGQKNAVEQIENSDMDPELKMKAYMDLAQKRRKSPYMMSLLRQVVPHLDDLLTGEVKGDGEPASSSKSKMSL